MRGIVVDPNPALEGGTVTVTFPHAGPWFVHVDGGSGWTAVDGVSPENLTVTIDVPAQGGGSFTLSDCGDPPVEIVVPVDANQ